MGETPTRSLADVFVGHPGMLLGNIRYLDVMQIWKPTAPSARFNDVASFSLHTMVGPPSVPPGCGAVAIKRPLLPISCRL